MHDFQFIEASNIRSVKGAVLNYACCRDAMTVLKSNSMLVMGLTTYPGFLFWMAMEWVRAGTQAAQEVLPGRNVDETTPQETLNQIGSLADKLMHEAMVNNRSEQLQHLTEKTIMLEVFSSRAGQMAADNLNGILRTIVVQTATTFEVLVRQLHDGARSEKPTSFLPLDPANPPSFINRDKMRRAYKNAFPKDRADMDRALNNDAINAVFLMRNVILHKAGQFDDEFIRYASANSMLTRLKPFDLHKDLLLDGKTVCEVVTDVFEHASKLVVAVDKWLMFH